MFRKPNLRFCFYIFIFECGVIFAVKVSFRFLSKYHISLSEIFNFVTNSIDSSSRIELSESSFSFSFGGRSLKILESKFLTCLILLSYFCMWADNCIRFCLLLISMSVIELTTFPAKAWIYRKKTKRCALRISKSSPSAAISKFRYENVAKSKL